VNILDYYYSLLKTNPLFNKFDDNELSHMLSCLRAKLTEYKKDEILLLQGDTISSAGIVVKGSLKSHREDVYGNKRILSNYNMGEMFCEELLLSEVTVSPFTLSANEQTSIIFIDCSEIPKFCNLACIHHSRLVANLIQMMAAKIVQLDKKIEIIQKCSIREKIKSFLYFCSEKEQSNTFVIPFTRQELADYIGVNRSAASRELWKMQREGIISFENKQFVLNKEFFQ